MKTILEEYKDLPYTLISHTTLPSEFFIFLKGDGLKKICEKIREGEDLQICVSNEKRTTFTIIDTHNKYGKTKKNEPSE